MKFSSIAWTVFGIILLASLVAATYYPSGTLTGNITANSMNWTGLNNYPVACPDNSAITLLNDSVTCSNLWIDITGDNMTGQLNMSANILLATGYNVTFDSGAKLFSNSTCLLLYSPDASGMVEVCNS